MVIGQKDDYDTARLIESLDVRSIRYVSAPKVSLGQLRNFSLEKAKGQYFCQWDDDDWHHAKRLEIQFNQAIAAGNKGSVLVHFIIYNKLTNQGYLSPPWGWGGTVLCNRKMFKEGVRYPETDKHEDSDFISKLYRKKCLYPVINPSLYVYVYHGSNTWGADHFEKIFLNSCKLSQESSDVLQRIVSGEYNCAEASEKISEINFIKDFDYFSTYA